MGRVAGKVAFVTGAGLGLGRASSLLLASEGARLVVSDIDEALAGDTAAEIAKAGGEALALRHDVSKPEDWSSVMAAIEQRFGRLDVLVNNAG
ncbi:SDR family NAD(P)-dependent oxidoreductase, partial [Mesorhizobium sp. M2A.F.Ca.ET.040.01.1.1]